MGSTEPQLQAPLIAEDRAVVNAIQTQNIFPLSREMCLGWDIPAATFFLWSWNATLDSLNENNPIGRWVCLLSAVLVLASSCIGILTGITRANALVTHYATLISFMAWFVLACCKFFVDETAGQAWFLVAFGMVGLVLAVCSRFYMGILTRWLHDVWKLVTKRDRHSAGLSRSL